MSVAVVMPVGPGREENVKCALNSLYQQTYKPDLIVLVEDGVHLQPDIFENELGNNVIQYSLPERHEPGMEQPRNIGARVAQQYLKHLADYDDGHTELTHVWFVDSDIVMEKIALEKLMEALAAGDPKRTIVAPYEWLNGAKKRPDVMDETKFYLMARRLHNDQRWEMFRHSPPERVYESDLSAGLACFSGNLLWNIDEFMRVGGFWSQIHHGRCEDGELGLRAVAMGVQISFCQAARGYHLEHPVNQLLALERNKRDVPMLNDRHPWVEQGGVFMVDRDGKAFDVHCACGQDVPSIGWWDHAFSCAARNGMADLIVDV